MNWPDIILILLAVNLGDLITGPTLCHASQKRQKSECQVRNGWADCSHLRLKEIPPNLPWNITGLDVSHNRLVELPPASLATYPGLVHLDVGFNSLTKLEDSLCQTLGLLRTLTVQHNESLTLLDVSKNDLKTANLGTRLQLPSLVTLILSSNSISTFKKDDFYFLSNSSSLRVLHLSNLTTLAKFEPDCLKPIASIYELVMNGSKLGPSLTSKLCTELSGTAIRSLSLQKTQLVTLDNTTFKGLGKTHLTTLDLSHNSIAKIGDGSFQWLSMLEVLSLEQNNLKRLTKNTFNGLGYLTRLNLNMALVKSRTSSYPIIDDFSFQPLRALESLSMENTAFRNISVLTFAGLMSLRQLHLSRTSCMSLKIITNQTFVSLAGSPLLMLKLTSTAISRLDPGAFSSLGNLTTLLLGNNSISQTLTGKEFQGLGQLQEIYLSNGNQKLILSPMSFVHVPALRTLMLGRALTSTLYMNTSPFKPLSNLTILDLSNNNIANIKIDLLDGLENLKVLKFQHNNLARLWKSANPGGPVLFLRGLRSLVALEMDFNGLDEIPDEALHGLTNLQELSLSGNILNQLRDSVFNDLGSLRVLRLQKNLITSVRKEVFGPALANLSQLVMEKNPFDCTCESILWFVAWLNGTNASVPGLRDEYVCNTPQAYYNRSIMEFDRLSCQDMTPFQALYVLTSTAVLTLMVTSLLVRFQGWRIQFYWNVLINRTLGLSDASSGEGREFNYDAYVIHAAKDKTWVERSLLPLEDEQGYTFYLQDRDAVPGDSRLESIVENMRRSRKILFVVTETLLEDSMCRQFMAHHALHQVIEDSRDSVVLVFLEDVQDYKLSHCLLLRRGMLRPNCLLNWPLQRERVPAFHQRLRIALGTTNRVQ
ncbi:toll-like receptor 3 isoform X2 [Oncorhynchus clarkii lewisi]|uniref:toll-like receptor 3 isoform X2 n=1 Tax=Oncorhynchus clarkii lewisi TaxID=490388 RepID=UPI0039B83A21